MCLIVFLCSLIDYFTELKITLIWIVEPLGFAYGIIAASYSYSIKKWISDKNIVKSVVLLFLSLFFGMCYLQFKNVPIFGEYILKIILGIFITAFMYVLIGKMRLGNRLNRFLSSISYEVYLLHGTAFVLLAKLDCWAINSGLFIILSLLLTIGLAVFVRKTYKIIFKILLKTGGR